MRVSSLLFAIVVLTLVISLLAVWFYPSVQDFMASNIFWNGIRNFSAQVNAKTIDSLDNLPSQPEKAALVAIPYLNYTGEELSEIKQFTNDGGTLLLMDDYGYGNSVLAYLSVGIRFTNAPLLDPLFSYKNQWLPLITDFAPGMKESGITSIVLNHATTLTNVEDTQVLAWSSSTSFLDTTGNETWDQGETRGPLPVAAQLRYGKGTVVLVSDPSVIINTMLGRDNNFNFIRYLTRNNGEQDGMLVDLSHLPKAPLDQSKTRLLATREAISSPYALVGITAMVFVVVSRFTLRKGEIIG